MASAPRRTPYAARPFGLLLIWAIAAGCTRGADDPPGPDSPPPPGSDPRAPGAPDGGDAPPPDEPPPLDDAPYPLGRYQMPLTESVAENLRRISRNGSGLRDDVFVRIGDSNSVNPHYLACFTDPDVALGEFDSLASTLHHFLGGDVHGGSPFAHEGEACRVSQPAFRVIEGAPSPLVYELGALSPRFAVIMIGTNDVLWRPTEAYARDVFEILDQLVDRGVVPLLSTLPPRADEEASRITARSNATLRAIAEARRIPLLDLNAALEAFSDRGLREDGVHLTIDWNRGDFASCHFDERGLGFAMNRRNLLTLEQLDRARRVVLGEPFDFDDPPPPRRGDGSPQTPFVVDALPFSEVRVPSEATALGALHHAVCEAPTAGRGFVYRLEVAERVDVRVMVVARHDAPSTFRLISAGESPECVRFGVDRDLTLEPGTYDLVIDVVESEDDEEHLILVVPQ